MIYFGSDTLLDKDKEEVTDYFNNNGFERWNKIYSESDEVNDVQRDIRTGHGQTIDKVGRFVDLHPRYFHTIEGNPTVVFRTLDGPETRASPYVCAVFEVLITEYVPLY